MTKQELFVELAGPNENGELQLGNGGSWCRGSSALAKKYVLEIDKTATKGNAIDHKDGRKNDSRVSNPATQKPEDFQPLCKAAGYVAAKLYPEK